MSLTLEQQEVVNHGKGNILVSASAGSGKTHTMVTRLIRLIIEENISVSEILAVTFTEASASDMKEKLRKEISATITNTSDEKKREKLLSEISELSCSDISTIHSFCGRLIRKYFFVAGIAPDFKVADDDDASVIQNECIKKAFNEFYDSGEPWFLSLVDKHTKGRTDSRLRELVLNIYKYCAQEADPDSFMKKSLDCYTEQGLKKVIDEIKAVIDKKFLDIAQALKFIKHQLDVLNLKKGANFTQTLLNDVLMVKDQKDMYCVKKFADYKLRLTFENKLGPVETALKEQVSELREKFISIIEKNTAGLAESFEEDLKLNASIKEHTESLIRVVKRFSEIYSEQKREENLLDFNDLEHFALKVLEEKTVCEEVREKFKYVLVDEYQDTNGVQEEIITKLENNNLFMVGDVKQSIYGFRGCRSEFFTKKDQLMSARGEKVVRLNANFRSAIEVVRMVNLVFCHAMNEKDYGENYAGKSELIFGGLYPEDACGRAQLHFFKLPEEKDDTNEQPRFYNPLEEENSIDDERASFLAKHVSKIIESELEKTYYDPKEKTYKKVTYGDIAILTRNRKNKFVNDLVSGLVKHGIPVTSDAQVNVCDYPDIKMLINVLKLVDCFMQDLPLASTLKSPIGNLTDEELYKIARFYEDNFGRDGSGFYTAYEFYVKKAKDELCDKLKKFNAYVDRIRFLSDFIGASGVLKKIVADKNIKGYFYAKTGGEERVNRLNRFLSAAESGGKSLSVREFLDKIENCTDGFGLSYFSCENTVKTMSIHASKGLEFPVVIVCGAERSFNTEDEHKDVLKHRELGLAVRRYDEKLRTKYDTPLRILMRSRMHDAMVKEEMRLFYVALTRATYSLHVTFSDKNDLRGKFGTELNSFIKFVPSALPAIEHDQEEYAFNELGMETRKVLIGEANEQISSRIKDHIDFTYPQESDTTIPLKSTATAVSEKAAENAEYVHVIFDEETTDKEKGIIAHKVLENFDFDKIDDFDGVVSGLVEGEILSQDEINKINLERIKSALNADVFNRIKGKKLYREKGFLINIEASKVIRESDSEEPVLLQGIIDLLAIDNNEAFVIDYKYSTLTKESLIKKYKAQLDLYSYAVEKVLCVPVKEKIIVNLFTGDSVKID